MDAKVVKGADVTEHELQSFWQSLEIPKSVEDGMAKYLSTPSGSTSSLAEVFFDLSLTQTGRTALRHGLSELPSPEAEAKLFNSPSSMALALFRGEMRISSQVDRVALGHDFSAQDLRGVITEYVINTKKNLGESEDVFGNLRRAQATGMPRVRVATLNVLGVPPWLLGTTSESFIQAGHFIGQNKLDIVATQENFQSATRLVGKASGLREVPDSRSHQFLGGHGLAFLYGQNHELRITDFMPFDRHSIFEAGISRGITYALIKLESGYKVNVYNFHLTTDLEGDPEKLRVDQVHEMVEFIQRTRLPNLPVIVMGDLNSDRGWRAHSEASALLGVETWEAQHAQTRVGTWDPKRCPMDKLYKLMGKKYPEMEIDLIFVSHLPEDKLHSLNTSREYPGQYVDSKNQLRYPTDHALVTCELVVF